MFVIKNTGFEQTQKQGQLFEREMWGVNIGLKIRPRTENAIQHIRDRFKGMKEGKKKDDAIFNAIYDYLLEDFGTVNPKTKELEPIAEQGPDGVVKEIEKDFEGKKKILFMPVPSFLESNYNFVNNKANELAFEVMEEEKGE